MQDRRARKLGLAGFMAMMAVMALTSAAFACTSLSGQITITGLNGTSVNGTPNGSTTYYGNGGDFVAEHNYGYCTGLPTSRTQVNTVTSAPGVPDFSLTVAPYQCTSNDLGADRVTNPNSPALSNLWEVRLVKAQPEIDTTDPRPVCHFDVDHNSTTTDNPTSRWVVIGTMNIDANGNGTGNYVLPSTGVGPANICIDKHAVPYTAFGGSSGVVPPIVFLNLI